MLIRIAGHHFNNPSHIDKMICIKGLPEEWLFRKSKFGKELLAPWKPDVEENIPQSIRHLCDPVEVTFVFPPIERGRDYVVDTKTVIGLKFEYMTEPGHELWEKIERYLDRMTPRDQKIPEPVLVAPNQKSDFNPHKARRTVRGSLEFEKCEIPVVDLRTEAEKVALVQPVIVAKPVIQKEVFKCDQCPKEYDKKNSLRLHVLHGHKKEKVIEQKVEEAQVGVGG